MVVVSAKTFYAYLSVYELANYSLAKAFIIFFARLLYSRAQKLQTVHVFP